MGELWSIRISYVLWFLLIYFLFMDSKKKQKIRVKWKRFWRKIFRTKTIRSLLMKLLYIMRDNKLVTIRVVLSGLILFFVAPAMLDTTQFPITHLGNAIQQTTKDANVQKILDNSSQMISSKASDSDSNDFPKTTTVTTKATYTDPDRALANNGAWKVLPQTTYDVETNTQVDYLRAIITEKTLKYIKWFLVIVFSVLGAFLVTLPFAKVEQLKFLGFEYKVIQSDSVEEVAADSLRTIYRKAEQAKFAAFRFFCSSRTTEINRKVWEHNNDVDIKMLRMVHFGFCMNSYLRLLEQQMTTANFIVYAKLVSIVNGIPDSQDMKKLKYRTAKDIVERAVEQKREAFWETPDKQLLFATPIFLDDDKESNDFFVVLFRSKEIGFSSYDVQLIEAVKSYIESQQVDLMRIGNFSIPNISAN